MLTKCLPHKQGEDHSSLFFQYKQPYEDIGIVSLKKEEFGMLPTAHDCFYRFFTKGIFVDNYDSIRLNPETYHIYQHDMEDYMKLSWLAKDYISNKGFERPVGVHWDPEKNKWWVHPGYTRTKILNYFLKEGKAIDTLLFNTGGKEVKFKKKFNNVAGIKKYCGTKDVLIFCVADHETLIPHVHFDNSQLVPSVETYFRKIKEFFRTTQICSNFDLTQFGYDEKKILTDHKQSVIINIDKQDLRTMETAMILLPVFDRFDGFGVKIGKFKKGSDRSLWRLQLQMSDVPSDNR